MRRHSRRPFERVRRMRRKQPVLTLAMTNQGLTIWVHREARTARLRCMRRTESQRRSYPVTGLCPQLERKPSRVTGLLRFARNDGSELPLITLRIAGLLIKIVRDASFRFRIQ